MNYKSLATNAPFLKQGNAVVADAGVSEKAQPTQRPTSFFILHNLTMTYILMPDLPESRTIIN
jgi:hypothetical protein